MTLDFAFRSKVSPWLVGLLLSLEAAASGCAISAEAPPQGGDDPTALGVQTAELGSTTTEIALDPHGGTGGTPQSHITPSAIIYGVETRSGARIDAIRFAWYQPRSPDNRQAPGDLSGITPVFGGTGGNPNGWWYCSEGKGIIGIQGSAGPRMDRLGVICGDVTNPDQFDPNNDVSPVWGGTGGVIGGDVWFDKDMCPVGRMVDSFNIRSGSNVDFLQAICISVQ